MKAIPESTKRPESELCHKLEEPCRIRGFSRRSPDGQTLNSLLRQKKGAIYVDVKNKLVIIVTADVCSPTSAVQPDMESLENMKVTIVDIARRLSLSDSTVSRVLNNRENRFISEATKKKVLAAAQEMGFRPN